MFAVLLGGGLTALAFAMALWCSDLYLSASPPRLQPSWGIIHGAISQQAAVNALQYSTAHMGPTRGQMAAAC